MRFSKQTLSYTTAVDSTWGENSWDCGHPGVSGTPADVLALRKRQVKHFCALLMLANGSPMIAMGDEILHSQQGHRNPYNIDSEVTCLDWDLRETNADVFEFFRRMISFRKAHPSLSRYGYWREAMAWHGTDGPCDLGPECRTRAFFLDGSGAEDDDLYVMTNAHWQPVRFRIQDGAAAAWSRVVDTGLPSPGELSPDVGPRLDRDGWYELGARSAAVFLRKRA